MSIDYDPYSAEAMIDSRSTYAAMLEESPLHYLPDYDAWVLLSYDTVVLACKDTTNFSARRTSPPSALMKEPMVIPSFATLDLPDHRTRRRVLNPAYTKQAAHADIPYIKELATTVLDDLLSTGNQFDLVRDYAEPVGARVAGHKAGMPDEDSEYIRRRCVEIFTREPGQRGSSEANGVAAQDAGGYLANLVMSARQDPSLARGDLGALLAAELDGRPMTDEEIITDLMTLLITGSETTEITVGATLFYLSQHPDQLAAVVADRSLIPYAFHETMRYDHPTDFLCRYVVNDVEVAGHTLEAGQDAMLVWASANRDPAHFDRPHEFDIHRDLTKTIVFGHGLHKCLGDQLAVVMGAVMIETFLERVREYDVDTDNVTRKYAEFVKGIDRVPITVTPR